MKEFDRDIVSGSVLRSVWKLTWPVTLLNLVNGLHQLVDHVLIGHYVSSESNAANAAVGVAWQVFLVIIVFIASIFHGMNVLLARYAGKQDRDNLGLVFYHSFLGCIYILIGIVAPIGYMISPWLLDFVEAPASVQYHALPYLRVLFVCGSPLFLMFMMTGAFQASGDPKTPLVLGILATILNIAISAGLITGFGPFPYLGAVGAAVGTVLASTVSAVIAFALVMRRKMIIPPPKHFAWFPDLRVMRQVARIGIPTGIQGVLLNLAGVFLLKFIGGLDNNSAAVMAAYTICYNQLFSLVTWVSFGLRSACSTIMGQNIGAGDPERGKRGVMVGAGFGAIWSIMAGVLFWFFPFYLLSMFDAGQGPVFEYGKTLLQYLTFSGVVLAVTLALTGGLTGAGETKIPMYIAFLTQIVLLLGICAFFAWQGTLTPDKVWAAILTAHSARLILTFAVFRTEAWAHKVVEI